MDTYPLAGLSLSASEDLNFLFVEVSGRSVKYDLRKTSGLTLFAAKKQLQVHQNNPVTGTAYKSSFTLTKTGRQRLRIQIVIAPERSVIVITDFDETLTATAHSSVNISSHHVQLGRKGDSLELFAGLVRNVVSPNVSLTSEN